MVKSRDLRWLSTILLWIFTTCYIIPPVTGGGELHQEKCSAILTPNFGICRTQLKPPSHKHEGYCSNAKICEKSLHVTRVEVEPFVQMLEVIVDHALGVCCGPCRNSTRNKFTDIEAHQLNRSLLNTSNIVYPVLGVGSATRIYGYHYIPLIKLSSGYYVTVSPTPEERMNRLITSAANLWPLLIIMLLLAFIAGFFIWTTDTWSNPEDFPREFFVGVLQGLWWAFVSMTTVGYGDKCPKFPAARLFSIIWILIGITICSMFTAALTNEITSFSNPQSPDMHGKNVGVMKYRTFDATSVGKLGGIIRESSGGHQEEDFVELKRMLTNDSSISGIYLDKYTFMHVVIHALELKHAGDKGGMETAEFFLKKTTRTRIEYTGEEMSYGMLIRDEEDFGYLHEFIEDNHAVYESCITIRLNARNVLHEGEESHNLFHPQGGAFYPTLIATLVACAVIVIFGVFFELLRTRYNRRTTGVAPRTSTTTT